MWWEDVLYWTLSALTGNKIKGECDEKMMSGHPPLMDTVFFHWNYYKGRVWRENGAWTFSFARHSFLLLELILKGECDEKMMPGLPPLLDTVFFYWEIFLFSSALGTTITNNVFLRKEVFKSPKIKIPWEPFTSLFYQLSGNPYELFYLNFRGLLPNFL